jgi:hypothetical protein
MHRIIVLLSVIVIGAAAPARAWCEASCLAPQHDSPAHCPSHEPAGDATAISATGSDECAALDSARPAASARLEASAIVAAFHSPTPKTSALHVPAPIRPHSATTVFERCTPLRI